MYHGRRKSSPAGTIALIVFVVGLVLAIALFAQLLPFIIAMAICAAVGVGRKS